MKHYAIREDRVAWRVVEGEAVLVHADTSAYYGLNRSATEIWLGMAGPSASREGLAELLAERCGVDAETAARDLDGFLDALLAEGLVSYASGSPGRSGTGSTEVPGSEPPGSEPPTPYEPPRIERFGQLETLILSGE